MTTGERIRLSREAAKMTQGELGSKCGTSKQTIFKYENGIITNIPLDKLEMIATALGVGPDYLLGWTKDEKKMDRNPTDSIVRQFKYLNEKLATLTKLEFLPNGISTLDTQRALDLIMQVNKEIVHTPRVAVCIDAADAVIGLKYVMCYLGLDWRKYDDDIFGTIIDSSLFRDLLKNMLNMYGDKIQQTKDK